MTFDAAKEYGRLGHLSEYSSWRVVATEDASFCAVPEGVEIMIAANRDPFHGPVFGWRYPVAPHLVPEGWEHEVVRL